MKVGSYIERIAHLTQKKNKFCRVKRNWALHGPKSFLLPEIGALQVSQQSLFLNCGSSLHFVGFDWIMVLHMFEGNMSVHSRKRYEIKV